MRPVRKEVKFTIFRISRKFQSRISQIENRHSETEPSTAIQGAFQAGNFTNKYAIRYNQTLSLARKAAMIIAFSSEFVFSIEWEKKVRNMSE